jgi:hypothetical protein
MFHAGHPKSQGNGKTLAVEELGDHVLDKVPWSLPIPPPKVKKHNTVLGAQGRNLGTGQPSVLCFQKKKILLKKR